MKRLIALITALVLAGCTGCAKKQRLPDIAMLDAAVIDSSVNPYRDCDEYTSTVQMTVSWTPAPIPFKGKRTMAIDFEVPDNWDTVRGVYIKDVEPFPAWIKAAKLSEESSNILLAVWEEGEWSWNQITNLRPYLEYHEGPEIPGKTYERPGGFLLITLAVWAQGTKPAPKQIIVTNIDVYLCDELAKFGPPPPGLGEQRVEDEPDYLEIDVGIVPIDPDDPGGEGCDGC